MIAHVGPLPVEEIVPSLTSAGVALLVARAWLMLQLRWRRKPRETGNGSAASLSSRD